MSNTPANRGGKGNNAEGWYGALLLSHLLSGQPLYYIKGEVTKVRFQAKDISRVDDFVVEGVNRRKDKVLAHVASRLDPKLYPSASMKLFVTFMEEYRDNRRAMLEGSQVLVLVADAMSEAAHHLHELGEIAKSVSSEQDFESNLLHQGHRKELKSAFKSYKNLIAAASKKMTNPPSLFELLKCLFVDTHQWSHTNVSEVDANTRLERYAKDLRGVSRIGFSDLSDYSRKCAARAGTVDKKEIETWLRKEGFAPRAVASTPARTRAQATHAATPDVDYSRLAVFLGLTGTSEQDRIAREETEEEMTKFCTWIDQKSREAREVVAAFIRNAESSGNDNLVIMWDELLASLENERRGMNFQSEIRLLAKDSTGIFSIDPDSSEVTLQPRHRDAIVNLQAFCAESPGLDIKSILLAKQWRPILDGTKL